MAVKLQECLEFLNNLHFNIKLTMKAEEQAQLLSLDVLAYRKDDVSVGIGSFANQPILTCTYMPQVPPMIHHIRDQCCAPRFIGLKYLSGNHSLNVELEHCGLHKVFWANG